MMATLRRLSDEEADPMESEEHAVEPPSHSSWSPWNEDTLEDIARIINTKLSEPQKEIIEAHLKGYNHKDIEVTEKYWRYHYGQAIKRIREELEL